MNIPTMFQLMRIVDKQRACRLYQGVMPFADYAAKLFGCSRPVMKVIK